jgi:hypothetical protein
MGVVLIVLGLAPRLWLTRELRRQGWPVRHAWRRILVPATPWLGVSLLIGSVNNVIGGLMMLTLAAFWLTVLVIGLVRGAWRMPTALRLLGDPAAWRGTRRPYWDQGGHDHRCT